MEDLGEDRMAILSIACNDNWIHPVHGMVQWWAAVSLWVGNVTSGRILLHVYFNTQFIASISFLRHIFV